jgi:hypothetical protein
MIPLKIRRVDSFTLYPQPNLRASMMVVPAVFRNGEGGAGYIKLSEIERMNPD